MKKQSFYDLECSTIRQADPGKMTPLQRANWRLIQALLDSEYERGFERGREVGKMESENHLTKDAPSCKLKKV